MRQRRFPLKERTVMRDGNTGLAFGSCRARRGHESGASRQMRSAWLLGLVMLVGCEDTEDSSDTGTDTYQSPEVSEPPYWDDCHTDCLNHGIRCHNGVVSREMAHIVPCGYEPESGSVCGSPDFVTCEFGCDPEAVLAANEGYIGDVSLASLCRTAFVEPGEPCSSDQDCRPSACDAMTCSATGACTVDGLPSDPVYRDNAPLATVGFLDGGSTWMQTVPPPQGDWLVPVDVGSCQGIVLEREVEGVFEVVDTLAAPTERCDCEGCATSFSVTDTWSSSAEETELVFPWHEVSRVTSALSCCESSPVATQRQSMTVLESGTYRVRIALRPEIPAEGVTETVVPWDHVVDGFSECDAVGWAVSPPVVLDAASGEAPQFEVVLPALPVPGTACSRDWDCQAGACGELTCDTVTGLCELPEIASDSVGRFPVDPALLDVGVTTSPSWLWPSSVTSCSAFAIYDADGTLVPRSMYHSDGEVCAGAVSGPAVDVWARTPVVAPLDLVASPLVQSAAACCMSELPNTTRYRPSYRELLPGRYEIRVAVLAHDDVCPAASDTCEQPWTRTSNYQPTVCEVDSWASGWVTIDAQGQVSPRRLVMTPPVR